MVKNKKYFLAPFVSCSSPRWDNLPCGYQIHPLKGLNLRYIYYGQKHFSE